MKDGTTVHPVTRVPGAYYVEQPDRPLTINWPNGIWVVARCVPVSPPKKA
jgi:hypothetical protein